MIQFSFFEGMCGVGGRFDAGKGAFPHSTQLSSSAVPVRSRGGVNLLKCEYLMMCWEVMRLIESAPLMASFGVVFY